MSEEKKEEQEKKSKKGIIIIIIIALVVIAALVGVIIYLLRSQPAPQPTEPEQRNVVVKPENVDEVIAQMEEDAKTPTGSYEVYMNTTWNFPDGESTSTNAFVENSTANTTMVFFTIALAENDEEVYQSPYMEVGSRLENIQLDKALEKGEYSAVITYHLVDDEFVEFSQVSMSMNIIIEN